MVENRSIKSGESKTEDIKVVYTVAKNWDEKKKGGEKDGAQISVLG